MKLGRTWRAGLAVAAMAVLVAGCNRRQTGEVNDLTASFAVNRARAPLGSAIEVTYTWTTGPGFKKLTQDYRALSHFLDSHKVVLFTDDHVPTPAPSTWEPNKTYSYKRTVFIPVYPYVGEVQVVEGLYPAVGKGERVAMKGEDVGLRAYKAAKMELLPQTENIFLVYKEGWHSPEATPNNPSLERTWTKKDALVSFKNPKKDVVVYLEADTCVKCFAQAPVLTMSVGGKTGVMVPIETPEVVVKKVKFNAADLGTDEWVDLRFSMNESFVPKAVPPSVLPNSTDDRELGLLVYHLYVGEADKLGTVPNVADAGPVTVTIPGAPTAPTAVAKAPVKGGKAVPAAAPATKKASPKASVTGTTPAGSKTAAAQK